MKPKRLHQRWRKALKSRIAAVCKLMHKHHPLSAKEVHDLRVALRRARLLVSLGRNSIGKSQAKAFRSGARVLLELISPIRDCDVAADWLKKTKSPAAVIDALLSRRARLWHLRRHRIRACRSKLDVHLKPKHRPFKLQCRFDKEIGEVAEQCVTLAQHDRKFSVVELHGLRRLIRRWRYLRELQLGNDRQKRDRRVRLLVKIQDGLGALQNGEAIMDQLKPLGRTKELREARSKLKSSFRHQHRVALHQIKSLPAAA